MDYKIKRPGRPPLLKNPIRAMITLEKYQYDKINEIKGGASTSLIIRDALKIYFGDDNILEIYNENKKLKDEIKKLQDEINKIKQNINKKNISVEEYIKQNINIIKKQKIEYPGQLIKYIKDNFKAELTNKEINYIIKEGYTLTKID